MSTKATAPKLQEIPWYRRPATALAVILLIVVALFGYFRGPADSPAVESSFVNSPAMDAAPSTPFVEPSNNSSALIDVSGNRNTINLHPGWREGLRPEPAPEPEPADTSQADATSPDTVVLVDQVVIVNEPLDRVEIRRQRPQLANNW